MTASADADKPAAATSAPPETAAESAEQAEPATPVASAPTQEPAAPAKAEEQATPVASPPETTETPEQTTAETSTT
jgi:hypothetical protein